MAGLPATVILERPATEEQLGASGWVDFVPNRQGLRLARYFWPSTADGPPKALLVLIHGHGAYLEYTFLKYTSPGRPMRYANSWVQAWNRSGYAVCGIDNQSCGRSQGARGLRAYIESFDDLLNDVIDFVTPLTSGQPPSDAPSDGQQHQQQQHDKDYGGFAGLPTFAVGISLGGSLAVAASLAAPGAFRGIALLSPMLSVDKLTKKGWNPYLLPLGGLFNVLLPTLPVAQTNRNPLFPEVQEAYDRDPACWHGPTRLRNAMEYLRACEQINARASDVTVPVLCVHGKEDTMTDHDGAVRFLERCGSEDKRLETAERRWHALVHEPGSEGILQMVTQWLDERCPRKE